MSEYDENAGSEWIESLVKAKISPLGKEVANLLDDLFFGIYHLDHKALRKVDWQNTYYISVNLAYHTLATFDYDELTRLVILCHDRAIRCEIEARTFHTLNLMFHSRKRDGRISERHPTIEEAIKNCRGLDASIKDDKEHEFMAGYGGW